MIESIYIHIPFCKKACYYCDFHFSTTLKHKQNMVDAILKELEIRENEACEGVVKNIYFGGGTPSVLSIEQIENILNKIYKHYKICSNPEITIEVNPDDFSSNNLEHKLLKNLGINRLSIGIQSFFDKDLALMGRTHDSKQAKQTLETAVKVFENVSIDLIYGTPTLSDEAWQENLQTAISFNVPHISSYALTVEEKTALYSFIKKGKISPISDEKQQRQFFLMKEYLEKEGYVHYELSNFGKEGYFSQNNTAYWQGKNYMGIGPSAHSYKNGLRSWNIAQNIKYIKLISQGIRPFESEELTIKDKYNEHIMTGLRCKTGVSLSEVKNFGKEEYLMKNAQKFIDLGQLEIREGKWLCATKKGMFFLDRISSDLFFCVILPIKKRITI